MARKIVQIAVDNMDESVYVVCDDGTLWMGTWSECKIGWKQIDAPFTMEIVPSAASNTAMVPCNKHAVGECCSFICSKDCGDKPCTVWARHQ